MEISKVTHIINWRQNLLKKLKVPVVFLNMDLIVPKKRIDLDSLIQNYWSNQDYGIKKQHQICTNHVEGFPYNDFSIVNRSPSFISGW